MDLSKFKTSDWLMVGGGAGFLIFGTFFPGWASYPGGSDGNAFDWFFRGTIPWILIVGTGVVAFLLAANVIKRTTAPWPLILLAATALGTFLNLLLVIMGPSKDTAFGEIEFDRGAGLFLSFISAVVALVGAVLSFKESGGDLNDLKDINKLKSSFHHDATPPPPAAPPAPPAPPA